MGCKRILISNKYFPTFNRTKCGIGHVMQFREITENSIITKDGKSREIDCLIYGTGFITDPRIYLKSFECIGEEWSRTETQFGKLAQKVIMAFALKAFQICSNY